ncbi:unnamed protein product [Euphydryas editha]|uniref:RNase H type-1 domain-containing protein n=1 Tax=Euphydryas editha TaxID=104508 RepID=A0AAU9UUH0_EUPED|nr:unnamed protein product [Euphydryas editha]
MTYHLAIDLKKCIRKTEEDGRTVSFFLPKAHEGTPGNERADELVKMVTISKRTAPDYDQVPISLGGKYARRQSTSMTNIKYDKMNALTLHMTGDLTYRCAQLQEKVDSLFGWIEDEGEIGHLTRISMLSGLGEECQGDNKCKISVKVMRIDFEKGVIADNYESLMVLAKKDRSVQKQTKRPKIIKSRCQITVPLCVASLSCVDLFKWI